MLRAALPLLLAVVSILCAGCAGARPGRVLARAGDEIVVCGQLVHTGAPVVLWMDPGGYDAYRVEKRFAKWEKSVWTEDNKGPLTPNRYGVRFGEAGRGAGGVGARLEEETFEHVRGGGWDLASLQRVVDQFVIHYDVCGTSRECFRVLHDARGLSVHFMLDVDGTIYQTLDVKERAWHATTSNDRSIGIEIAQIGAYPPRSEPPIDGTSSNPSILDKWYSRDAGAPKGMRTRVTFPPSIGDGGVRTPNFVARPARESSVTGEIQGKALEQYDFTPQQYESLIKLTAALCTVFPNLPCDYPRDEKGELIREKLPDDRLAGYRGLLGHYHIQSGKVDPGPAFDWEKVVRGAKRLMR
ncbi:MAG: N-acetylmuramoyl-L-alanine amidase [Phycisphaerales bacterium]